MSAPEALTAVLLAADDAGGRPRTSLAGYAAILLQRIDDHGEVRLNGPGRRMLRREAGMSTANADRAADLLVEIGLVEAHAQPWGLVLVRAGGR